MPAWPGIVQRALVPKTIPWPQVLHTPEIEGDMYSSSRHVTSSRSASGEAPLGEDMASNSSLVDQPLPVLMSINRMCLSDEPERMYGGRKSIDAILKKIDKFTIRARSTKRVPPVVVVLEHPEWISIFRVPDSDGPVARGGCQEIPCQCNGIDSGPVTLEDEVGRCIWEEVCADGFVFEVVVRSRLAMSPIN